MRYVFACLLEIEHDEVIDNFMQPLLKKKYYDDCPGCKVDRGKELSQGKVCW